MTSSNLMMPYVDLNCSFNDLQGLATYKVLWSWISPYILLLPYEAVKCLAWPCDVWYCMLEVLWGMRTDTMCSCPVIPCQASPGKPNVFEGICKCSLMGLRNSGQPSGTHLGPIVGWSGPKSVLTYCLNTSTIIQWMSKHWSKVYPPKDIPPKLNPEML